MKRIIASSVSCKSIFIRLTLFAILSFVTLIATATTGTFSWTGSAGDGKWSTVGNWSMTSGTGTYPGAGTADIVQFSSVTATISLDVTLNSFGSITFSSSTVQFIGAVAATQTTNSTGVTFNSTAVVLSANTGVAAGQGVAITSGTGTIPQYCSVNSISSTNLTLSNAATVSSSAACTLTFYAVANSITTTNCTVTSSTVILGGAFTVNNTLDFSAGTNSKIYLFNSQAMTVGNGTTGTINGMSSSNYFCSGINPYLQLKSPASTSIGTIYCDPSLPTFYSFGLTTSNSYATLATNIGASRLSFGTGAKLTLQSNIVLSFAAGGTSTFTTISNNGGIDASASGSGVSFTGSYDFTSKNLFVNSNVSSLTMNKSSGYIILGQPISVTTLNLTNGTLVNTSTNNITIANGGTVNRSATGAILTYPPVYGTGVNVNISSTTTAGSELLGTSGTIGTLTVNNTFTYTLNSSGVIGTAITAGGFGYGTAPAVTFNTPTNGTAATGTAVLTGGVVTSVYVTSPGVGYTSSSPASYTIAAAPTPTTWTTGTSYSVNATVISNSNLYVCTTGGIAGATAPSGTGTGISDGTDKWSYISANGTITNATGTATYSSATSLSFTNIAVGNGSTGILQYPNVNNPLTLNVSGNVTVNTGGQFNCGTQTNSVTHLLNIGGNIANSGTLNMINAVGKVVDVTLNGTSNQSISTGTSNVYNNVTVINNATNAGSNTVNINGSIALTGLLTIGNATVSGSVTVNNGVVLTLNGGLVLSNSNTNIGKLITTTSLASGAATNGGVNNGTVIFATGGSYTFNSGSTLTNNGYLKNAIASTITPSTLTIGSYAVFEHAMDGGTIPTTTWPSTSTLSVTGITATPPSGLGQTFGIVNWSCTAQTTNVTCATNFTAAGTVTVLNTGTSGSAKYLQLANSATTVTIGGLLTVGGGTYAKLDLSNTASSAVTVSDGVTISANGTLQSSATSTLSLAGNWSNAGTFTSTNTTINFNASGGASQTITTGQSFNNLTISNYGVTIPPSLTATGLLKVDIGNGNTLSQPLSTTINSSGGFMVNTGTFTVSGSASTVAQSTASAVPNAVLKVTSAVTVNSSLNINGYLQNNSNATTFTVTNSSSITFGNFAVYEHACSGGNVPNATWGASSYAYFTGTAGTAPTIPASQTFGNVLWNCIGQTTNTVLNPTAIAGSLIVLNSNTRTVTLSTTSTASTTINVANITVGSGTGGYTFNGGTINTAAATTLSLYGTNTAAPTISLSGNVLIQGYNGTGTATLNTANAATLNIQGNWTLNTSFSTFTNTNLTVGFNGSGTSGSPQTITGATTFGILNISNATFVSTSATITTSSTTTISASATFAVAATYTSSGGVSCPGSFQLNAGGYATTGTWNYGSTGTLIFNNTTSYGVNSSDVYWPASNGPVNVTILQGGLTLNSGANRTVSGLFQTAAGVTLTSASLTLNGTAQLNTGGYFNNAPIYGTSSLLKYNTGGTFARSNEWSAASGSVGTSAGLPQSVQLSNSTTLNYPPNGATTAAFYLAGYLTIDNGSAFYMDYGSPSTTGDLHVAGNVTVNGNLSLGKYNGDLYVGGNWSHGAGSFNSNSRAVFIDGGAAQTITNTNSSSESFPYLIINNTLGGVQLNSPTTVTGQLTLTNGILSTTTSNLLSVTNTANSSLAATTSFSATTFINGPLAWTLPNGTSSSTYVFPIGSGSSYYPISLANPVTSTNGTVAQAQAFLSGTGGTYDGTLNVISTSEYWSLNASVGNITGGAVSLTRTGVSLGSFNMIGTATSLAGTYTSIGGTTSGQSINTSSTIPTINAGTSNYYTMAFYSTTPAITGITGGASSSTGYYGTTLTINGANFSSGATVSFNGGSDITSTFMSSTSIQVVVPLSATNGNITVTSGGQTTAGYAFSIIGFTSNGSGDWNSSTPSAPWPSGYIPATGSAVVINSAVTVNSSVSNTPNTLTINGSSSLTFGASGALSVTTTLSNSGSIVMTAGGALTLSSGISFANSGTFTYGTGTIVFSGTGSITGTTPYFNNVSLGGAITMSSAPTIYGTITFNAGASLSQVPIYTSGSTLTYNGTAAVGTEWGSGVSLGAGVPQNVTIASGTITTPASSRNAMGNLTISSGGLTLGANLQVNGSWNNSGTFTPAGYTVTFGGTTSSVTITNGSGTETFYSLTISNSSGVTLSSNVNTTNLSLTSGTLDVSASNYALRVAGNFANSGGSFNARTGTVTLNGSGTQVISGSNTFYNLTDVTAGATIQLTAGTTQTINGTLTLTGAVGNLLNISSSAASIATINPAASSVSYCSFAYITNSNVAAISTSNCTNGGNNTNITFNGIKWIGGSAGNWEIAVNWSTGTVPSTNDNVVFDNSIPANTSPTVTLYSSPTINNITYTNSNVTYAIGSAFAISGCTTTSSSASVTLGSSSSLIFPNQTVTTGTGATFQSSTAVLSVQSTTAITLSKTVTTGGTSQLTFTPIGTMTVTSMSLVGSIVKIAGSTFINSALSLTGGSIFSMNVASGNTIQLGNGGTFSLTNDASNYFSGNGNGNPSLVFLTSTTLTPYFDPTSSNVQLFGLSLSKINATVNLGSSVSTNRLTMSASGANLVVGANNTLQ